MCGIVGYCGKQEATQAEQILGRMANRIAHRGPDDHGIWASEEAGLGHRRLSIVDLASGHQPMQSADGALRVSFNGEIFNHVELRETLKAKGHRFRTTSDTEVILHLYEEMDVGCVEAMNGDFAFAIWDQRRHRMVLARDRMGVRPLFYAKRGETMWFASEIKALLQVPGIKAEIDPIALDQVFTLWAPIAPRSMFKGISELPPAHLAILDQQGLHTHRYWQLAFPDQAAAAHVPPALHSAEDLRELLDDAVALRMRADVPVGTYLSGGLDSSLVSALAARHTQGLRSFSVTFDTAEHDESVFQAQVAQALGTQHSSISCGAATIAQSFPAIVAQMETIVPRTAPAPLFHLSRHVRDNGLKVVLTGEGADEVFAGYDIFKEARVRRFCARQPRSLLRPHLFRRLYPYLPALSRQTPAAQAKFFGIGLDDVNDPLFSHRPRMRATAAAKLFYSGDLVDQLAGVDSAAELAASLPADFSRWHPLHQAQYIETTHLLPGYILSSQGDRMAMAHGVEARFPFLDHRLVEFAAGLPPEAKLHGLVEKDCLRRMAADLLPPAIAARPKQPYRAPDACSFFGIGEPAYVSRLMAPEAIAATGLFNPQSAEKLTAKCRKGAAGFRDNAAFVGMLSTQLWHQAFVPGSLDNPTEHVSDAA